MLQFMRGLCYPSHIIKVLDRHEMHELKGLSSQKRAHVCTHTRAASIAMHIDSRFTDFN